MNLRCFYCQTPFTLSTEEKITALRKMHAEDLHHYDAHCPRCGRANPVSRERLEMFTPGWETAIKEPVGAAASMPAAPSSTPSPMMGSSEPRTAPAPAMKKEPAKAPARRKHATTAAKKATKKTAAAPKKKVAVKKKPAAKAKPKKTSVKSRKPAAKSKAKKR